MSSSLNIEDIDQLIAPYLIGYKVLTYHTKTFAHPGDNYGSILQGVILKLQKPNGKLEFLDTVAKLLPTNELFTNVFKPERTFRTEISCYALMAPELHILLKNSNVSERDVTDVFPKCYGARTSLSNDTEYVDSNAVLLLENLNNSGYKIAERHTGFDEQHTFVILRDLASFHALGIAERMLKPQNFDLKFRPYLEPFSPELNFTEEMRTKMLHAVMKDIENVVEMTSPIFEKIMKLIDQYQEHRNNLHPRSDTLFTTIVHSDLCPNNIIIHYNNYNVPTKIKILDYQLAQYDSLVHDVSFFLFSNVQTKVLREKFDELLHLYYKQFIHCLELVGCSTDDYSYRKFEDEFNKHGPSQLYHIIMLLRVLYIKKESPKQEFNEGHMSLQNISDETYRDKLNDVIHLFVERGWL